MDASEIQREDDKLIMNDVARAVEEREFTPYVQPSFDLESNKVVGAEVLVRWVLPEDGALVPAAAFVPSLERTHTICGLDWFIIDDICSYLAAAEGPAATVPMAINISYQHAEDTDFAQKLVATADWRGVARDQLSVEISGGVIAKNEQVLSRLVPSVISAGFGVVPDNYNAGASMLRDMADKGVKVVKLAAGLWRDGDPAAVREVVLAARELGLQLIAEGVENDDERKAVLRAGITRAQGYGLARPMSLDDYTALCMR